MALKNIGALWRKKSKNEKLYWSGEIELNGQKTHILVFRNDKKKENQPDYSICISDDDDAPF